VLHAEETIKKEALLAAAMQVYGTSISLSEFQRQLKAMRSMTVAETNRENKRREAVPKKASKQRHGSGNGRWVGAGAGALKRALDWLKLNDISLDIHYKKQMRSLGTVGLEWVAIDGGVTKPPKRSWLTKAGLGRGVKHTHVGQLRCEIQSQASPMLVDGSGGLTTELLQQRPKRIRLLLNAHSECTSFLFTEMARASK
jgi:hypothetical protein